MCESCFGWNDEDDEEAEYIEPEPNYDEAVLAGATWLDQNGPENWRSLVNVNTLDLGNADHCILGQVYASYAYNPKYTRASYDGGRREFYDGYDYWCNSLEVEDSDRVDLGFSTDYSYSELTRAWKRYFAAS